MNEPAKTLPMGNSHVVADQSEAAAFLAHPKTFGVERVERIDTHGAMVFLAGKRAYKIKRAVAYPYMDFSTLEKRRQACVREVALNRRTAPRLYLGVCPVRRGEDGALGLAGTGDVVEWAVVMRRFAQNCLFDRMAQAGKLSDDLLCSLGDEIATFHDKAEPVRAGADGLAAGGLRWVIEENAQEFSEYPWLFPDRRARRLGEAAGVTLAQVTGLLEERRLRGLVRRCHGDLHLRNICLFEDRPTLFDAIEFNDRIACIDVAYDFAFLLMDLDHRGLRRAANLVFNRYFQAMGNFEVLAALPLFLSLRAAVRAKVSACTAAGLASSSQAQQLEDEARRYFAAAEAYLKPAPARLVAIGGLSGSGKTCLAQALAPDLGPVPGALHLRSDVLRKAMYGIDELTPLPAEAYRPEISDEVYRVLRERTRTALRAGHAVVLDAVNTKPEGRRNLAAVARECGAAFTGFWLEAPPATLAARTLTRSGDASDATPDVVRKQLEEDPGPITWNHLDASGSQNSVVAAARRLLGDSRHRG